MSVSNPGRNFIVGGLLTGLLLTVVLCCGCAQSLGMLAYALKGDEVDPICDKMTGKVAIVCRPRTSTSYQYSDIAIELARDLNKDMAPRIKKPKKCQLIPQSKVEEYCDGMEAETDFLEIGKALGADQVIGIDLISYNHVAGTNVWQGRCETQIQLLDVETGNVLFEPDDAGEYVYPKSSVVPSTDMKEYTFQSKYLKRYAHQLSKYFVPYDRTEVDF